MTDPSEPGAGPTGPGIAWGRLLPLVAAFVLGVGLTLLGVAVLGDDGDDTEATPTVPGSPATTSTSPEASAPSSTEPPPPSTVTPTTTETAGDATTVGKWETFEIELEASTELPWSAFPVQARFEHPSSATDLVVDGFWDGGRRWVVRFAPPAEGEWRWSTSSDDTGLDGRSGELAVTAPADGDVAANPNRRGHLRVSADGRYLERADGTPFFWLGDTAWWLNSERCPLTAGPATAGHSCADYLDDRVAKGFSVVALAMFDIHDANEGGYPFPCNAEAGVGNGDYSCLNEAHFETLDTKLQEVWDRGLVAYANVSWFVGQLPNEETTPADAELLGQYLMARYGWMPMVFSLAGEYQYGYDESGVRWTKADWDEYGAHVQAHNPQDHPVTIHPSSSPTWGNAEEGAGDQSSSGQFHAEDWLDVNSIQSGQNVDRLQINPQRVADDYARTPSKPVLHAEGFYLENDRNREPVTDAQLRWQAYVPFLNGALGHMYGAQGVWQMYVPDEADYPELDARADIRPWWEVMTHPSSADVGRVSDFYQARVREWWDLVPRREWLGAAGADYVGGETDPHLAVAGDGAEIVVYFGDLQPPDEVTTATDPSLAGRTWESLWFDPRTGTTSAGEPVSADGTGALRLPDRPSAGDWALVLTETG